MDAESKELIEQQKQDDRSDHVSKDPREVSCDPWKLIRISDDIQAGKQKTAVRE